MTRLLALWRRYNGGPALLFVLDCEPPEDIKAVAEGLKARYDAMGSAITAGVLTPTADIEAIVRDELGLPALPKEATADWKVGNGIRRPNSLQAPGTAPANPLQALRMLSALDPRLAKALAAIQDMEVPPPIADNPFPQFAAAVAAELDDDAAFDRLLSLLQDNPAELLDRFGGDTSRIADWLASETIQTTEDAARKTHQEATK